MTDIYIGGPPKFEPTWYRSQHRRDRLFDGLERLPPTYRGTYLEQALAALWDNPSGWSWFEIYLQLEGIKRIQETVNRHVDDIYTLQLVALYRHKEEST